ncbi:MAG: type II toxin-antitoxin system antitoxin SocA domain-containing protein [Patescibacteria group bacterium]
MSNTKEVGQMASDVAKYFLYRAKEDGDYISPLRIQKLVYYGYVWPLVLNEKKLFSEQLEAWPNGPVVPSLYKELKSYVSSPIDDKYLKIKTPKEFSEFLHLKFDEDTLDVLDQVYNQYMTKTPFELVLLTHNEAPWKKARERMDNGGTNNIFDSDILEYYSKTT